MPRPHGVDHTAVYNLAVSIQHGPQEHCGRLLRSGEHMDCYSLAADSRFVVKILRDHTDNIDWTVARRMRAYDMSKGLPEEDICPTYCMSPAKPDNRGYFEVQQRVDESAFDSCVHYLNIRDVNRVKQIIGEVWRFEQNNLWRRGRLIQDTKSYLKNIAFEGGKPFLLDFCSLESHYQMGLLFFEGPWRIFRVIGTIRELESRVCAPDQLRDFSAWYRTEALQQYSRERYERLWRLDA